MGQEHERADTSVFMDERVFNSTIEPILKKKENQNRPVPNRDPRHMNAHLQVDFEDIIAEPKSTRSLDSVWIGSHALFELINFVFYRILTTLLAVPLAFVAGLVFAILSCIHIWVLTPLWKSCTMLLPSIKVLWTVCTDVHVSLFSSSVGRCLSSCSVKHVPS